MDRNTKMYTEHWIDEQLALLSAGNDWHPNVMQALVRLNGKRYGKDVDGKVWIWVTACIGAAVICILAFPSARDGFRDLWSTSHFNGVNIGQVSADVKALKDGEVAPDFTSPDANGHIVRLSAYKGRVVLLNFWATWCHGCQTEIPWLVQFENKYHDGGLSVIGVAMDDSGWKAVKPFLQEKKVNYHVVIGNDEMARPYGLSSMPMTFLIDRNGRIAATSVGVVDRNACEKEIRDLLRK